jgi:hypothetical protein
MRFLFSLRDRDKLSANVVSQVKAKVRAIAERNECSMTLVVNTILADALNVSLKELERYDTNEAEYLKLSGKARSRT